jgi:hypothetical protein
VLCVAHDARIVPYADKVFDLEDGRLKEAEDEEPGGHSMPTRIHNHTHVPR